MICLTVSLYFDASAKAPLIDRCPLAIPSQAFCTRWYYSRAARRDFVLQLLAQHRRNMSKYLLANMCASVININN